MTKREVQWLAYYFHWTNRGKHLLNLVVGWSQILLGKKQNSVPLLLSSPVALRHTPRPTPPFTLEHLLEWKEKQEGCPCNWWSFQQCSVRAYCVLVTLFSTFQGWQINKSQWCLSLYFRNMPSVYCAFDCKRPSHTENGDEFIYLYI